MEHALAGEEFDESGASRSYIIVSAVPGRSLESCFEEFLARHADAPGAIEEFTVRLAEFVKRFHDSGLTHRDLYASHIFLDETAEGPRLYLIDLARVFRPWWRRFRWRVKDLAELKYSLPDRWVRAHWEGFLAAYVARIGGRARKWAGAIDRRVARMRRRSRRRRERRGPEGDRGR